MGENEQNGKSGKVSINVNFNTILNSLVIAGVLWVVSFLANINTRLTKIETTLDVIKQKVP